MRGVHAKAVAAEVIDDETIGDGSVFSFVQVAVRMRIALGDGVEELPVSVSVFGPNPVPAAGLLIDPILPLYGLCNSGLMSPDEPLGLSSDVPSLGVGLPGDSWCLTASALASLHGDIVCDWRD